MHPSLHSISYSAPTLLPCLLSFRSFSVAPFSTSSIRPHVIPKLVLSSSQYFSYNPTVLRVPAPSLSPYPFPAPPPSQPDLSPSSPPSHSSSSFPPPTPTSPITTVTPTPSLFTSWSKLIKLDLSTLAAFSCVFGYYLVGGPLLALPSLQGTAMLTGTMLTAFSAAILNQYIEVPYDRLMERTRRRPLVTGAIPRWHALVAMVGCAAGGAALLWYASGGHWQAPVIALGTIGLYAFVYTRLKRVTPLNTEFGALVGSLPVLVGAAVHHPFTLSNLTSSPSLTALLGFAFMSAWQMPHFMMIAHMYAEQYARAGFRMRSPATAPGVGLMWASSLLALPFLGFHFHLTSPAFMVSGTALNVYLLSHYVRFYQSPYTHRYRAHIYIYFVLMFAAVCLHAHSNDGLRDVLQWLSLHVVHLPDCVVDYQGWMPAWMRDNGELWKAMPEGVRSVCGKLYHDQMKQSGSMRAACPVVIGREVKEGAAAVVEAQTTSSTGVE